MNVFLPYLKSENNFKKYDRGKRSSLCIYVKHVILVGQTVAVFHIIRVKYIKNGYAEHERNPLYRVRGFGRTSV